jgi:hypothetical protein
VRVAITGAGVVAPIALSFEIFGEALRASSAGALRPD